MIRINNTYGIIYILWYTFITYFIVKDSLDFHNFTLNVYSSPNQPPIIVTDDKLSAFVNINYSVDYDAIDDRTPGDYLLWTLNTNAGEWLTIDTNSGLLNGLPSESDVGQYWINISINDGEGGIDFHNFTLTVESTEEGTSKEDSSFYWLIWLVIILIIIISLIVVLVYKRTKAKEIPTYRAELILTPPTPKPSSGALTLGTEIGVKPGLPTPISQIQTQVGDGKAPVPMLAPKVAKPVLQLPQATLSKTQQLNLLRERLLRGEISEEIYNKLRSEIEGDGKDNDEIVEDTNIN